MLKDTALRLVGWRDSETFFELWFVCYDSDNVLVCIQGVIEVREGSWFGPLKDVEGKLVGLVSNPPYIPSDDIPGLQAEVGRHEPRLALDGGVDGTDSLLHLCDGASRMLTSGGFFAFEVAPS